MNRYQVKAGTVNIDHSDPNLFSGQRSGHIEKKEELQCSFTTVVLPNFSTLHIFTANNVHSMSSL